MIEMLVQFLTLATFIAGLVAGEIISYKAFGRPKSPFVFIIDIILIIFIISAVYAYVGFYSEGIIFYVTNFVIGLLTIMVARGIEWGLGLTQREGISTNKTIDIIRVLAHHGLDVDEIKGALKQFGLPHKGVEKYGNLIEKAVPAYVPKMVKMEKTLESIDERVRSIEKKIYAAKAS
jgi:hypothetical protein